MGPIYIVCGFPRSGTSMMMRCLEAGGIPCVYSDDSTRDRDANPHGYYECDDLRTLDWHACRGRAVKVIRDNLPLLPRGMAIEAVYVRRDPAEIERSWRRLGGGRCPLLADYEGTVRRDVEALAAIGANAVVLHYAAIVASPVRELVRLGWPIDVERAAAVVDPTLYRSRIAA